ncbi:MAG: flagellar M-ring protein FliF [Firmicutes bacterium]|jgi:flagellar M-ring protein FliF|nr:flagellar M-ring protein FliF [Bacillota bacterium]HQD40014.1 flagellar basal-body MS-ring/collar protein FliF [Bacillota bacterium]
MGGLSRLQERFGELWQGLTKTKKLTLVSAAVATLVFLLIAAYWFGQPKYATLFSDLAADDAGEIIAKLKEDGIPYQLQDGGRTILIPQDKVYETRLNLAASGMPQGGTVGFELFNQSQLGSTDFDRQLKYNWALQGELVRTIRQLNEIADARVHIVQTGQSLFVEEEQPATASVFLKVKPMKSLEKEQIQAIANLVAGSVKGLKPENVTILDQYGRLLSEEIDLGSDPFKNKAVAGQLELKRNYERELERSIQSMLERVYGPGKAVARVNAELDFDWSESNLETYEPAAGTTSGLVRSEDEREEIFQGQGSAPGGPAGVASNVPGYVAEDEGTSNYEKRERSTQYELNRRQEKLVTAPGQVKRLSATVWVDGNLTPRQQTQIQEAVQATIGFQEERGDQVAIQTMPFDRSWMEEFPEQQAPALSTAVILLLCLIPFLLYLLYRLLRGKKPEEERGFLLEPDAELAAAEVADEEEEISTKHDQLAEIERIARQQPKEVAKLIETWLHEE